MKRLADMAILQGLQHLAAANAALLHPQLHVVSENKAALLAASLLDPLDSLPIGRLDAGNLAHGNTLYVSEGDSST
jgi:hypothetical protein